MNREILLEKVQRFGLILFKPDMKSENFIGTFRATSANKILGTHFENCQPAAGPPLAEKTIPLIKSTKNWHNFSY